jgi:1,2-diacylglycerol 3-alpha-glucosyltransferase
MVTNTFTPHVGGVARSVLSLSTRLRVHGHVVRVAAPAFDGSPADEPDVIRLPALRHWRGSEFSLPLPLSGRLRHAVQHWHPDVVHSHHPFLLGDSALRVAASAAAPIVFTHHTRYEFYTHYAPGDSPRLGRFAAELATGYANLCDAVIAPSQSLAQLLHARGVTGPIEVIPTGIDCAPLRAGDGAAFRASARIPADALVVGHVGRLAPEKNLGFLTRALVRFAREQPRAHVLIVGDGPCAAQIDAEFARAGLAAQLHRTGTLQHEALWSAYRAMDVFAFSSCSETQGIVLAEAMAAGVPVVALDAPGTREVVTDGRNGRLLPAEDLAEFCRALHWLADRCADPAHPLSPAIAETARSFSLERSAERVLGLYTRVLGSSRRLRPEHARDRWSRARRRLREEWKILAHQTAAARESWSSAAPGTAP